MKKILALVLTLCMVFSLAACSISSGDTTNSNSPGNSPAGGNEASKETPTEFHIGIVTGTVAQSEDELRGAEAFIAKYGSVADGGIVMHATYPDNFSQELETTITQIASFADDPLCKAIVVNQSVPGTVSAFNKVRETRPDILLIAGEPQEDPSMISAAADFAVSVDNVTRGYLIIEGARKMGATSFVHISFPRHMGIEVLSRRRDIMKAACEELGLSFFEETAPDPTSDVGIPGAQQYILEQMPSWVDKYGKDTAFFCTNDAQTEPLLKRVAELGAIFVEPDLPSPIMGYPGAFGIQLTDEAGNWPAILSKVEQAVVDAGGSERMGTWAYSYTYTSTAALAEFAKRIIEGKTTVDSFEGLMECYQEYTPGAEWNGAYYMDAEGVESKNHVVIYQDTYVFGKGYLGQTSVDIPSKYRSM